MRTFCPCCSRAGHGLAACPKKRRDEAAEKHAKWVASGGPAKETARIARQAEIEKREKDSDTSSEAACSTAPSMTGRNCAVLPKLTDHEEKEARKHEKLLRDICKIEKRIACGEKVDALQVQKVERRVEIEQGWVMTKVRAGYLRV